MTRKDHWVMFAMQALRVALMKTPKLWFTAESFVMSLGPDCQPPESRWHGAVFQRAKREGLIRQVYINEVPVTSLTRSGHQTPVWTGTR